jgi:hypothetical protein
MGIRIAAVDFSRYREVGYGAGVAIYEWPNVVDLNRHLVQVVGYLAQRRVSRIDSAVKLILYGFHLKEHGNLVDMYVRSLRRKHIVKVVSIPNPTTDAIVNELRKEGVEIVVFDTPSRDEMAYINDVRMRIGRVIVGKTHVVSISDIAAYYAALHSALQRREIYSKATEVYSKEVYDKIERLKKLLLPHYLYPP